jgi:CHAT domain-containing protein
LVFALGHNASYVLLLDAEQQGADAPRSPNDGITIVELPPASDMADMVAALTDTDTLSKPARSRSLGKQGYDMLIKPVADKIAGKDLLIVPGEALCYLPFELLIENDKYLVENHRIRYAPSMTALHMLRLWQSQRGKPAQALYAMGDPLYDVKGVASTLAVRDIQLREGRTGFAPLKHSGEEVRTIAKLLSAGDVWTGKGATESEVRQASASGKLAQYRYVHFATHGILGEQPALVLSLVGNDGERDEIGVNDGFLRLGEVANLRLNADLVVLSACRTGQGRLHNGEGVSGLARAFMYAGTRGVLCSLWAVDDRETSNLMVAVYGQLKADKSAPDALRAAQLEMIKAGKPPLYWAPFILIGE